MKTKSVLFVVLCLSVFFWSKTSWSQADPAKKNQLTIKEPLSFTIPSDCGNEVKISLWLFSKDGDVKDVSAKVLDVKAPDGSTLSLDKVGVTKKSDIVTRSGTEIILSLNTANLPRAGEYALTMLFQGNSPQVPQLQKVITLKQPAANLNLDELKDRTFKLTRSSPWGSAQGQFPFFLHATNLTTAIRDLKPFGQEVFLDQTRIQVPGILSVQPPDPACLGQNQQMTLALTFGQFDQTGTFTSSILLISPSFDKPIRIPLKVEVTDCWFFPLVVILAGVILGFIVGFLKKTFQPRQRNLLRLTKLRAIVVQQISLTQNEDKRKTLFTISKKLEDASTKILEDNFSGATADLDEAQKGLDEFLLQNLGEKFETRKKVEFLNKQIEIFKRNLDAAGKQQMAALQAELQKAITFLSQERVEPALEILQDCQKQYDDFRENHLRAQFHSIKNEILKLPQARQDELKDLSTEVEMLINDKNFDEAYKKLFNLESEVRPSIRLKVKHSPPQPGEPSIIQANNPTENRVSGTKISFTFHPAALPKDLTQDNYDAVEWNFGDGTGTCGPFKKQTTIQHTFDTSGTYTVEIQLLLNGLPIPDGTFSRLVEIRAGKTEMSEQGFRKGIWAANWGITVAALLLAAITGLIYLYLGKPFGTIKDYLLALLWGFGINESVKGFTEVYGKITS